MARPTPDKQELLETARRGLEFLRANDLTNLTLESNYGGYMRMNLTRGSVSITCGGDGDRQFPTVEWKMPAELLTTGAEAGA